MIARLAPASLTKDIGALLAVATASHARAIAVLVLISLISFLPGSFNIPPVDRDEARFAQATKQMIESGDYIDIRFQDEVRYKKPVGIYWLQAGVVRAAEAVGIRDARSTIWLYRVPSLLGAIGAVAAHLLGRACFHDAANGVPRRPHDGDVRAAQHRSAPRQDRCGAVDVLRRRDGRDGARVSLPVDRPRHPMAPCIPSLDRARRRNPAEGSADPDGGRARGARSRHRGSLGELADATAADGGCAVDSAAGAALVRGDHGPRRRQLPAGIGRAGPDRQDLQGAGDPRRAARLLPGSVLGDVLARCTACSGCSASGVAASPRAAAALPAGMGRTVLARVRAGRDQAAALRAPALSGGCDPDRARDRAPRAFRQSASDALHRDVADLHGGHSGGRGLACALHARPVRLACLAFRRGRTHFRVLCLAALRCRRRGALLPARGGRHAVHDLCGAGRRHSVDAAGVSERRARRDYSRCRLPQSGDRRRGIPRAEPRVPDRHPDTAGRRLERRGNPARRRLPLCDHRVAAGTRIRAARRADRIALPAAARRLEGGFNINGGRQVSFAIYRAEPPL